MLIWGTDFAHYPDTGRSPCSIERKAGTVAASMPTVPLLSSAVTPVRGGRCANSTPKHHFLKMLSGTTAEAADYRLCPTLVRLQRSAHILGPGSFASLDLDARNSGTS